MDEPKSYVTVDALGVKRVAGTRISLDSVAIGFQEGQSAEEIQRNFPELHLEQVYGAITYYLSHRAEVDEYLLRQRQVWNDARAQAQRTPNAAVNRLRQTRAHPAGEPR